MTNDERAEVLIKALYGAPRDKAITLLAAYNVKRWHASNEYIEELENTLQAISARRVEISREYSDYDHGYDDALAACADISDAALVKRGMLNYGQPV